MSSAKLSTAAKASLDSFVSRTLEEEDEVPMLFFGLTSSEEELYLQQGGLRIYGNQDSGVVTEHTHLELFSATKLPTSVCALQLVDRELISLDEPEDIACYLPEVARSKVLVQYDQTGRAVFEEPRNRITLRMLLNHTAGYIYHWDTSILDRWMTSNPQPRMFSPQATMDTWATPLAYHPGTSYRYSQSIDFVGVLVERVSGLTLEDYMRANIWDPLDIRSITFYPTDKVRGDKTKVCERDETGNIRVAQSGMPVDRPKTVEASRAVPLQGGAGLYGTARDYLTFLRGILQCGTASPPINAILSRTSFDSLFLPTMPTGPGYTCVSELANGVQKSLEPRATPENTQHSTGLCINITDHPNARRAFSGFWSGAARTDFWLDPTTGIAGVFFTQVLGPYETSPWNGIYRKAEELVYASLQQA